MGKNLRESPNLFFDTRDSVFFRRNADNIIFQVTASQLPVMKKVGLDSIFLSKDHILEPHWHPNAAELDYVVSGEAIISVLDPLTPQLLTYPCKARGCSFYTNELVALGHSRYERSTYCGCV